MVEGLIAQRAALAWRTRGETLARTAFLDAVLPFVPDSDVRAGIAKARRLGDVSVSTAASALGNGSRVSAQDTVPLCLWCAGGFLDDYAEALWQTVAALGDRDTTCAIVGGIVALRGEIPAAWLADRESLDGAMTDWDF